MTYEKMVKMQKAMDYIVYMIVGSYFNQTKCSSPIMEKRMFLYYKDISINTQYTLEESCINYVEKKLMKELPSNIWNEPVKVTIKKNPEFPDKTYIIFTGNSWKLKLYSECITATSVRIAYDFIKDIDHIIG